MGKVLYREKIGNYEATITGREVGREECPCLRVIRHHSDAMIGSLGHKEVHFSQATTVATLRKRWSKMRRDICRLVGR